MNPEYFDIVFDKLYHKSALEVFITPIIMKKSRPAYILSVICNNEHREELTETIFRETSSIGIRESFYNRTKLRRKFIFVQTKYGKVKVKLAYLGRELVSIKPEYDYCKQISIDKNIPLKTIVDETLYIITNRNL